MTDVPASETSHQVAGPFQKIMLIAEENATYDDVIGSPTAPYLTRLAATYGSATSMTASAPVGCPSLPSYLIMTSGSRHGVCDDAGPSAHPIPGPSIFSQVAGSGRQWRNYAESMSRNCQLSNHGRYLVRHAPAAYYVSERERCGSWDVPLGTVTTGALHTDLAAGRLPAYAFVTPDACDDMHRAPGCTTNTIGRGDSWLRAWLPHVLASPDYRVGRLIVLITWDEGSSRSNHVPTLVISPATSHRQVDTPYTTCSVLRTTEDVLGLPVLGCAAGARSMVGAFGLG